jgi:hypothetical protein
LALLGGLEGAALSFLGSASSSEKDSHTVSSLVTGHGQFLHEDCP